MAEPGTYIYRNRLIDPGKFGKFTPEENQVMSDHFAYLKQALPSAGSSSPVRVSTRPLAS